MQHIGAALLMIFCTPFGWIGMLCFACIVMALKG